MALRSRAEQTGSLILLALLFLAALRWSPSRSETHTSFDKPGPDHGDITLHAATVARIAAGHDYYDAVGTELRERGYPTRSVFNWRTPLLFSAVAQAPALAQAVLFALGALLLLATVSQVGRESVGVVIVTALGQAGAIPIILVPDALFLHEAWTGVLLGLSMCLYLKRRWTVAAATAALALFVRELAAPYCVVSALLAVRAKRRAETAVWCAAGLAYAFYYVAHIYQVHAHARPGDLAHPASWIQFGGLPFVLSTLRWNGWLSVSPIWSGALAFVLIVAAVMDREVNSHLRLTGAAYLAMFAVVGYSFNDYWGAVPMMIYPLLMGCGVQSLWRLSGRTRASEILAPARPTGGTRATC
jgi:hypothetical protein